VFTSYTAGAPSAVILGRRGWVIGANGARAESRLRGLTCAGAYVDEGSLVPREFFTQLLGRMSVPGAKLFVTINPDNPAHWLRRDFLGNNGLDLRNWHFQLGDNPSLTREYIAAISAEFTGLWYRRFILGEWVAAEGAVYDMWDDQIHVIDVVPAIQSWVCAAIDYGTTNPFHALLLGLGVDGNQ
jgi:PBSX family phage terminase large subunit